MSDTNVEIGITADDSGLVSGMEHARGAVEHGAEGMKESLESVTEAFKLMAEVVGVGISLEWAKEIVEKAGEAAEQVENLSKTLGIATQQLQEMTYGAALVGGNLDTISAAGARLERSMEQAAAGSKQQLEALRALGISAQQLPELMKNPGEAFELLAKHVSEAGDGMGKTAAVMELFGRGGAAMIPFLDKFGSSLEEIKEKARALGVVLSNEDQAALVEMQDNLNEAGLAAKGMGNEFALALAPAINAAMKAFVEFAESETVKNFFRVMRDDIAQVVAIGGQIKDMFVGIGRSIASVAPDVKGLFSGMGGDVVSFVQEAQDVLTAFKAGIKGMWIEIQAAAAVMWSELVNTISGYIKGIFDQMVSMGESIESLYRRVGLDSIADRVSSITGAYRSMGEVFKQVNPDLQHYSDLIDQNVKDAKDDIEAHRLWAEQTRAAAKELEHAAESADHAGGALVDYNADVNATKDTSGELAKQMSDMAAMFDQLQGKVSGPYEQAWSQYDAILERVNQKLNEMVANGLSARDAMELFARAEGLAFQNVQQTTDKLDQQADILGKLHTKLDDNTRMLAATGIAHKELQAIIEAETEARKLYEQHLRDTPDLTDKEREHILQDVDAHHQMDEAIKNSQEIMKGWVSIGANGLDQFFGTLNKDIIEGGNLMKDLANVWKSVVEAILLQAEKLLIINPILNSIFGTAAGGGNLLPTLMNSAGGLFGGGGAGGSGGGMGGIGNLLGMGGGGGGNLINSWMTGIFGGSSVGAGGTGAFAGAQAGASQAGIFGGGGLGGAMPILGGAAAAFGEYNAAGGGLGGAAGAAAYGIGTATLISAAGTAMSAGIAAGMAAIPVVGWIALAAMGINMLTGGGLFGTAWKVTGGEQDLNIGPNGVSAQDLTNESRKRAFFGGTAHRTITKDDAAATASLQDFATQLQAGLDSFMAQFGDQTAQIVAGTFKTTFDKHGKATGTSDTVLGVTRTGETAEQFTQRIQADSFLAALDKMGLGASKFVEGLQGDTQKLLAAVQDFAATTQVANANVAAGFKFLALGADQSLKSVMLFVEGLNHGGETLSQTYQRLAQAQAQYNQFVGQFAQAPTYVDPFEASVAQLRDQMKQAEAQANALAEAAGASGASLDDLDNIQRKYQQSLASLTAQLQANAQSLAFSLGLTTMGSLDQIDAEIKALEGSTTSASTSLSQFGGAVHDVAAKTNAALDLMLGNLSPLNDQQKLQYALQGLHAGTVSADTVLGIGRSLYASSEAYNVLFNQVLPYAGQKGQGGGGYTGTASSIQTNNSTSTLSPEDQAKLDELKRQRDILEKQQQLNQFQTLAQQVAEIAQAKGETVDQVLADMGISLKDLEKGLGIANDEDFKAYMEGLQKQTDSAGDNTRSIVAAIDALPSKLAQILGMDGRGQTATANSTTDRSASVADTGRSRGTGGASTTDTGTTTPKPTDRTITDADAKALGKEFYNAMVSASRDTAMPGTSRNLRAMGVF